jgi:anti-sigma B factor antagonist
MAPSRTPPHWSPANTQLDLQVSYRLGTPLVYVKGELDHQTAPQLRAVIAEESATAPPAVILELSKVSYMDSGGLSLLFDTLTRLKGSGWLGVVGATSPVARLMEITGLTDQPGIRVLPDLDAAATALSDG